VIIQQLQVRDVRCVVGAVLGLDPRLNLLVGPNGAGKSSLLEALHVLAYGRSFRGRVGDGLVRSGAPHLEIYAEWTDGGGLPHRAGLRHAGSRWEARLDGDSVGNLGALCAQVAVVCFEPGSHELIGGGSEHRRRFLDWGLFHVEPDFLPLWRRYARALKQRNALLKCRPLASALSPWDQELSDSGEALTRLRQAYLDDFEPVLGAEGDRLLDELGAPSLEFRPGWRRLELSLLDALLLSRERDLVLGHTSIGPHRADWRIGFAGLPGREALSRGQEKLAALACLLAQARHHAERHGDWPVICLDDLASELDPEHQSRVLETAMASGAQLLISGTQLPSGSWDHAKVFHVERGSVRENRD
jgi:DNA replication and repair protein RecF